VSITFGGKDGNHQALKGSHFTGCADKGDYAEGVLNNTTHSASVRSGCTLQVNPAVQ
jgi:hypothetical protein